jgi:hypothetical protein
MYTMRTLVSVIPIAITLKSKYIYLERITTEEASMIQLFKQRTKERREQPDKFIKIINGIVLVSVFLSLLICLVAFTPSSYKDFIGIRNLRGIFNNPVEKNMMHTAVNLMFVQLCISIIGFTLSILYHKRKNDKYHYSLILFGGLSLMGIVLYVLFY